MKVTICAIGLSGWYPLGISRMIQKFYENSPGYAIKAWINALPFGAPAAVIEDGWDYTAYCAKPYALLDAVADSADIAILVDAAFYPIRDIGPLVEHVAQKGYYLCKNGNNVGEWSSDRCLDRMGMTREEAFTVEEASSYCVGLNFNHGRCVELLQRWRGYAGDRVTFPGPHTNDAYCGYGGYGRNTGLASTDARVKGHRHDQTVLSILAHRMGMVELVERPKFTAYLGSETEETVLVNQGGAW